MSENKTENNETQQQPQAEQNTEASNTDAQPQQPEVVAEPTLEEQLNTAKAQYLTAVADLDNARKRFAREREELLKFGPYGLALEILPFVDSFTLALEAAQKHDSNATLEGFGLLKTQLDSILNNAQIQKIEPQVGDDFNPDKHESVAEAPSEEVPHHQILAVQRPGYSLHDRLLRPAMVILSSGKAE